jgi:hypothetical protein
MSQVVGNLAYVLVVALAVGGCGSRTHHDVPGPPVTLPSPDTVPTASTISDTEMDLAGGPENATAIRLGNLVLHVNRYSQRLGSLPFELAPVLASSSRAASLGVDLWGRAVRYTHTRTAFELRSSGADAEFETPDDIWTIGEFGRDAPCVTHIKERRIDFADITPPCSLPASPGERR